MKPDLATDVIIVNFNTGLLLIACVQSAIDNNAERIIVVDNASHDDSISTLSQAIDDKRLTIIRNSSNLGFAAACNIGIEASTANNLLFLNPDCQLGTGALRQLLDTLHSAADIGMAGGLLKNPDGSEQRGGRRNMPTPLSSMAQLFRLPVLRRIWPDAIKPVNLAGTPLPEAPVEMEAISGACMLIKRSALNDVGLWDEGYFLHCEDLDWCKRFAISNWRILFVPDASVTHVKGASSTSDPVFVEWHKHLGMLRFYEKFYSGDYPRPMMWLVSVGIWLHFALVTVREKLRFSK